MSSREKYSALSSSGLWEKHYVLDLGRFSFTPCRRPRTSSFLPYNNVYNRIISFRSPSPSPFRYRSRTRETRRTDGVPVLTNDSRATTIQRITSLFIATVWRHNQPLSDASGKVKLVLTDCVFVQCLSIAFFFLLKVFFFPLIRYENAVCAIFSLGVHAPRRHGFTATFTPWIVKKSPAPPNRTAIPILLTNLTPRFVISTLLTVHNTHVFNSPWRSRSHASLLCAYIYAVSLHLTRHASGNTYLLASTLPNT